MEGMGKIIFGKKINALEGTKNGEGWSTFIKWRL